MTQLTEEERKALSRLHAAAYLEDSAGADADFEAVKAALVRLDGKLIPSEELRTFYGVATYPELVAVMDRQIASLQERIQPLRDTQPGRTRGA